MIYMFTPKRTQIWARFAFFRYLYSNNILKIGKNMSKKNTIRLTESDLKRVISESVKKVLKENDDRNKLSEQLYNDAYRLRDKISDLRGNPIWNIISVSPISQNYDKLQFSILFERYDSNFFNYIFSNFLKKQGGDLYWGMDYHYDTTRNGCKLIITFNISKIAGDIIRRRK